MKNLLFFVLMFFIVGCGGVIFEQEQALVVILEFEVFVVDNIFIEVEKVEGWMFFFDG